MKNSALDESSGAILRIRRTATNLRAGGRKLPTVGTGSGDPRIADRLAQDIVANTGCESI